MNPDEVLSDVEQMKKLTGYSTAKMDQLLGALREAIAQRDSLQRSLDACRSLSESASQIAAKKLNTSEQERDQAQAALERLAKACAPIDLWLGGYYGGPPTNDERHEFVLALSVALQKLDSKL